MVKIKESYTAYENKVAARPIMVSTGATSMPPPKNGGMTW
jgi:hypothetical protein